MTVCLFLASPALTAADSAPVSLPAVRTTAPVAKKADLLTEEDMAGVTTPHAGKGANGSGEVGSALARMLGGLVLVAGLVVGLGWLLKRMGAARRLMPQRGRHLTVVETVPLGLKRSVSLLRLGDRVLVVGQAEQGMASLGDYPATILGMEISSPPENSAKEASPEGAVAGFQARLREFLNRKG